jgi:sucrose-6-phosphate hydrolase SacC (GH32 family)
MNDPNGPMFFNGIYHLFYQYNPNHPYWGDMHWGHAVSKDLVFWQHLPPALYPDQTYDQQGVFSGSATLVNGKPIITYTGIGPNGHPSQCIAFPTDISDALLVNWTKSPANPVIPNSPPSLNLDGYRDPTTAWQDGSVYYMIVGAGISGTEGMALLYQTDNFVNWTYLHPLYNSTNTSVSGDMWECPDFYPLGDQFVMKASTNSYGDMWFVGTYSTDNLSFSPINQGLYDFGKMYASKTFDDTLKNRRILWGWTAEMDGEDSSNARGWAGMQSLPRELTLTEDNKVAANPIADLAALRTQSVNVGLVTVDNKGYQVNGISTGDQFEMLVTVVSVDPTVTKFGINVLQSSNGQEQTQIFFLPGVPPTPVDMPGNDYRGVAIPSTDPNICQTICFEDWNCRAWTYTPPGMQAPSAMCFLKSFPPAENARVGCVSGRKTIVAIDRSNSTVATDADKGITTAPMPHGPSTLHIFVDHSVIEIFANNGTSNIITRVYPTLGGQGVSVFVEGEGRVQLDIQAWELGSIWSS